MLNEGACIQVTFFNPFWICFLLHVSLCLLSCGKITFYAYLHLFWSILLKQSHYY